MRKKKYVKIGCGKPMKEYLNGKPTGVITSCGQNYGGDKGYCDKCEDKIAGV